MYRHLFGPVPSRRLGMSLGVDLVPHKVCTLNCLYCECGATTRLTHKRDEYVPISGVTEELRHFFSHHPDPEVVTFSGAGEPTLHSGIGQVAATVKELVPHIPLALITNGTLFHDPGVRREAASADILLPSLDAATPEAARRINRPSGNFRVEQHIRGLECMGKEFAGEMWLEVLILPGYNDDEANLLALGDAIGRIRPDRVQLNTLDRPGVVSGLRPASRGELEQIASGWGFDNLEIIAAVGQKMHLESVFRKDILEAVRETLSRRPCTPEDIRDILGLHVNEINKYLRKLSEEGRIETTRGERGTFYRWKKF